MYQQLDKEGDYMYKTIALFEFIIMSVFLFLMLPSMINCAYHAMECDDIIRERETMPHHISKMIEYLCRLLAAITMSTLIILCQCIIPTITNMLLNIFITYVLYILCAFVFTKLIHIKDYMMNSYITWIISCSLDIAYLLICH